VTLFTAPTNVEVDIQTQTSILTATSPSSVELVINEGTGASSQPATTQSITDMTTTPGSVYVGLSAVGTPTSSPLWRIYKIVESDSYPMKIPSTGLSFIHIWDDRTSLVYENG
jgi:hypothetical protein